MIDEQAIRTAARDAVAELTGAKLDDDDSLIASGRIDSLSIVRLIVALERRLNVSLPPGNLQPDDFDTINWIVDTVKRCAVPV
jgi:acyl carrier protein